MTGTEKIIAKIQEDAQDEAEVIRENGRAAARSVLDDAKAACAEIAADAEASAADYLKLRAERSRLNLAMERRQALLAAKGGAIEEVLAAAKEDLLRKDPAAYFAFLLKLLEKQEAIGDGALLLSAQDLARKPADFEEKIEAIAASKGGKLILAKEAAAIEGGFIIHYSGTSENCSLEAIFASEGENLKDIVRRILFTDAEAR